MIVNRSFAKVVSVLFFLEFASLFAIATMIINPGFHDYLRKGFPLVDIDSHTKLIPQSMIEKIKSNMIDLYDIDGLRGISVDGFNLIELI